MSYRRRFHFAKESAARKQAFVMYPIMFYVLSFAFFFSVTAPSLSASGGWAATYGDDGSDRAISVQQTGDGGYIVAGETFSFGTGDGDVWILKLKPGGIVEWQKTYGGVARDWAQSVQQTGDGGYIVAGETESFGTGSGDFWVLKLSPDGTVEWEKAYGGVDYDRAYSIKQTGDGGYIVAGETTSYGAGHYDSLVLKLGPDGTVQWQKTYGGVAFECANFIQQTSDGGYIVAGETMSFGAGIDDFWVLKLSADGTVEWEKTYGGDSFDEANSIEQTGDGGYIVAGETMSFGAGKGDVWILKLSADGTVEWEKTYGGVYGDRAYSIQQTGDVGYIVACWTASFGAGIDDFWVLKLGPDGDVDWQKTYGGVHYEWAYSIQQTGDGGYIMAGEAVSFGLGVAAQEACILKLSPDGSINPSCYRIIILDTTVSGKDSSATVGTSSADVSNTNARPQDSSAIIQDTDVPANILCR